VADFSGWEKNAQKFDAQVEKVIRALTADDSGRRKPPEQRLWACSYRCPFLNGFL
jgi:hypothetical protein